jgi:FKBP-type peptidyl-prolyl cis-trans isomerase
MKWAVGVFLITLVGIYLFSLGYAPESGESFRARNRQTRLTPQGQQASEGAEKAPAAGLQIEDLKEGTGEAAKAGDQVTVHYTGWLMDGTQFESSLDRNEPYTFRLGSAQVIKGWDRGVPGMKVGGKRKLTIPPELAYRETRHGKIPANSELVFVIELLKIK